MVLTNKEEDKPKNILISLQDGHITLLAIPGKNNLIKEFELRIGKKLYYYPVNSGQYMDAFEKAFNKMKPYL
jgi:hypothetical protein